MPRMQAVTTTHKCHLALDIGSQTGTSSIGIGCGVRRLEHPGKLRCKKLIIGILWDEQLPKAGAGPREACVVDGRRSSAAGIHHH